MDVRPFLIRTRQLGFVRDFIRDEPYPCAVALLSIHSAIALNDALLTVLQGRPYKGQDHREAVRQLQKKCAAEKLNDAGLRHLSKLINQKTPVAYGDEVTTTEQAERLRIEAERFEKWAYTTLKSRGVDLREL